MFDFLTVTHDGQTYSNFTAEDLSKAGVPQSVIDEAIVEKKQIAGRNTVRSVIAQNVGDTASIVGTVADGVGLLIAIAVSDVVALSSTTSFADYKKAKMDTLQALAGEADIKVLAADALQKIQSGEVVLTASMKGLESVLAESLDRSTAVAGILSQVAETENAA